MDSADLRAVQQPLKDAYREDPGQALITLRPTASSATGHLVLVCTGRALARRACGPAPSMAARWPAPGHAAEALVACAGVTLQAMTTWLGCGHRRHGQRRGGPGLPRTLAVSKDAPFRFRSIRLAFDLETRPAEQIDALLRLTVAVMRAPTRR